MRSPAFGSKPAQHGPWFWIKWALFHLVVVVLVGWASLVFCIDLPSRFQIPAVLILIPAIIGILSLRRWRFRMLASILLFVLALGWWFLLQPSQDRLWRADAAQTAWAKIDGQTVTIHNLRNFTYETETNFKENWETKTVTLDDLRGVDLFLSYWTYQWVAHPIVSFQFADGQQVAVSVEMRREVDEFHSPLRAFFRRYELIYVFGEERDLIKLRTNHRHGDEVYLYRTNATPEQARDLFLDYVKSANRLNEEPEFFNAITSSCDVYLRLRPLAGMADSPLPCGVRLLLNGKSDELAYQLGMLAGSLPFDELKRQAQINDAARAAGDGADFSKAVREGRVGFVPQ